MQRTLLLGLLLLLVLPSAATAATAKADIKRRSGTNFGPVTFQAAKGERNRVTVTEANGRLRFHDSANRVKARGDCDQVDRHTAICPFTEDIATVKLGNRNDRATVSGLVEVLGGGGNDVLRGSTGHDILTGQRGNDTLRGGRNADVLTAGPGRDRVYGGAGDDDLIDGETDKQAAADLFRGGSSRDTRNNDRGDQIDYSLRKRALDIDLSRDRVNKSPEGDRVRGLESVIGGSGNDRLSGDGDDNYLEGNAGDDRLRGRGGDDIPQGGKGADRVSGDDGHDVVWGDAGVDHLRGGNGDDLLIGRDGDPDQVECGLGNDDAVVTRVDTLAGCEIASSSQLRVTVQPDVQGNKATFQVACLREGAGGCSGTIAIASTGGEDYGTGSFSGLPHGADTFAPVEVQLTNAGKQALHKGELVEVTYPGSTGGYRAFLVG